MDADLCVVASWSESVTEKVDLTASEHAGVAETKTNNTNFIDCDVDKASKKHMLTYTQKRTLNQDTESPVANDILHQESEKNKYQAIEITQKPNASSAINQETPSSIANDTERKNHDLLYEIGEVGSASNAYHKHEQKLKLTNCELCGVYCNSPEMLNIHISGRKHQKKLKNIALVPIDKEPEIGFFEGSKRKASDSLSSQEDAVTKKQKVNEEEECNVLVTCKVCNVSCKGFMAFQTHLAAFEHSAMQLKQDKGRSSGLQENDDTECTERD